MSEEKMDEMIKRAAASYNAPPTNVPREEMWSAIRAARTSGPRVVYGSAARSGPAFSQVPRRIWISAAAAAALLVVAGIGVGRWSAPAAATKVASTAHVAPVIPSTGGTEAPAVAPEENTGSPSVRVPERTAGSNIRSSSPVRVAQAPVVSDRGTAAAYQLVTLTHLSNAEAMLTSFRSHTDEKMDAAMAKWARDLLTNTRLLLDSPAAADPRRRQLLEDLELTLVDIVQLSPASGAQDRQMIEKSLDQGHVLTRLRSAIPAGTQKGS
jgi:hypothetical protein